MTQVTLIGYVTVGYGIIDLPAKQGNPIAMPSDISEEILTGYPGSEPVSPVTVRVAGWTTNGTVRDACIWSWFPNTPTAPPLFTDFASFTGTNTQAFCLNDHLHSQVVGHEEVGGIDQPTVWERGIGAIPLAGEGRAFGINNFGNIVGFIESPNGHTSALWPQSGPHAWGAPVPLAPSAPNAPHEARRVNDNLNLTGTGHVPGSLPGFRQAFRRDFQPPGGNPTFINPMGAPVAGEALDINTYSDFVGVMNTVGQLVPLGHPLTFGQAIANDFAFEWTDGLGFIQLPPTLPTASRANGVNGCGEIVGTSGADAVYWRGRTFFRLYDQLSTTDKAKWRSLSVATGINNRGEIVGWGFDTNGAQRGWLMYPIKVLFPETVYFADSMVPRPFHLSVALVMDAGSLLLAPEGEITFVPSVRGEQNLSLLPSTRVEDLLEVTIRGRFSNVEDEIRSAALQRVSSEIKAVVQEFITSLPAMFSQRQQGEGST